MAKVRLTAEVVRGLDVKPQAYALGDAGQEGLQVRVQPTGAKFWQVRYRPKPGGREALETIGPVADLSVKDARAEAARRIDLGRQAAAREPAGGNISWDDALDRLERLHLAGKGACDEIMRTLRRECAGWKGKKLAAITADDVAAVLNPIEERGAAVQRNRTLTYIRLAFAYWIDRRFATENPAATFKKIKDAERGRGRHMDVDELVALLRTVGGLRNADMWRDVYTTLVLTGCRLSEVTEARVEEIDLDRMEWTIPAERMKAGRPHVVPLAPWLWWIIERRIAAAGPRGWLFSFDGNKPAVPGSNLKQWIDKALKPATPWRNHDIRHGVRTGLVRVGVRPDIAERCIAHVQSGIAGRYDHHEYGEEKRAALNAWASFVAARIWG